MHRAFVEGIVLRAHEQGNYLALDDVRNKLDNQRRQAERKVERGIYEDYEESKFIIYGLKMATDTDAYKVARARLNDLLKEHNLTEEEILSRKRGYYGNGNNYQ